ncbi:hypothetical protein D3C84_778880 [compost metagenome]
MRSGLSMEEVLLAAQQLEQARQYAGFDQASLDSAARHGFGNGVFEESEEDNSAVIEEFYSSADTETGTAQDEELRSASNGLARKLEALASSAGGASPARPKHIG